MLTLVLSLTLNSIITKSYSKLEQTDVHNHLQRALKIIKLEQDNLQLLATDWSVWDDSFQFITKPNQTYINSNLVDSTYTESNLAFIAYINRSGKIIYGQAYDLETEEITPLPEGLLPHIQLSKRLLQPNEPNEAASGLISLPEGNFLISSLPILTSNGDGPSPGVLIMGRRFDEEFIARLSNIIGLSINTYSNDKLSPELNTIAQQLTDENKYQARIKSAQEISGYTFVYDINNKPILLFNLEIGRAIYQQSQTTKNYMLLMIVIIMIVLVIMIIALLRYLILNRLSNLSHQVNEIQNSKCLDKRIHENTDNENSHDEINHLVRNINNMLSAIQGTNIDLEKVTKIAEEASKAKSDFLSSMSHELRTPLNAILGFGQVLDLDSDKLDKTQQNHIKEILDAGYHLMNLINELLDFAKIESGKMKISMAEVPVNKVLQKCITMISSQAAARHVKLIDELSIKGYTIEADPSRLKQVLLNLLSNAVKYNHNKGSVIVDSEIIDKQRLRIRVTDTGKGLTEEDITRLFIPFDRLDAAPNIEGTGIGLVITQQFVEAMGGTIGVDSELNKGSTFWVEFALVQ